MRIELAYDSTDIEKLTGIDDCRLAILSIDKGDGLCEWKDSSRHAYSYDLGEYSSIEEAEKGLVEYLLMVNAETIEEPLDFSGATEGDR